MHYFRACLLPREGQPGSMKFNENYCNSHSHYSVNLDWFSCLALCRQAPRWSSTAETHAANLRKEGCFQAASPLWNQGLGEGLQGSVLLDVAAATLFSPKGSR